MVPSGGKQNKRGTADVLEVDDLQPRGSLLDGSPVVEPVSVAPEAYALYDLTQGALGFDEQEEVGGGRSQNKENAAWWTSPVDASESKVKPYAVSLPQPPPLASMLGDVMSSPAITPPTDPAVLASFAFPTLGAIQQARENNVVCHQATLTIPDIFDQGGTHALRIEEQDEPCSYQMHIPTSAALVRYFAIDMMKEIWPNMLGVFISCVLALYVDKRHGKGLTVSYIPLTPTQVVLGFLVGFYLNKAFERNKHAFDGIQTMSIHTRSACHHIMWFLYQNYRRKYWSSLKPEFQKYVVETTEEIVALCKYFYTSCCVDLNTASLMKELDEDAVHEIRPRIEEWDDFMARQVRMGPIGKEIIGLNRKRLQSGLHFARMMQRWIDAKWQSMAPTPHKFLPDVHSKEDFKHVKHSYDHTMKEFREEMQKVVKEFTKTHGIAHGRKSPVHFWLLGMLLSTICLVMPWVIVRSYGYMVFIPCVLLAYIFFGARQIGADFWEPFGMDANGLVDINLEESARVTCRQLDAMLEFFDGLLVLQEQHDESNPKGMLIERASASGVVSEGLGYYGQSVAL